MSVLSIKAKVECDVCGKTFDVGLDGATKCKDPHEAVLDAMSAGEGSIYDEVMRCEECTSAYVSKWVADNPNKISGLSEVEDGWRVTTYAEVKHFVPKASAPRAPQFDEEVGPILTWAYAPRLLAALKVAERFMAGFEGDELQEGIDGQLSTVRRALAQAEGRVDQDAERCLACRKPFMAGDRYYPDASGDFIHADCCGPERESYTNADGEPLGPDDPIPEPAIWGGA